MLRLSVVIPARDAAATLAETVGSALTQGPEVMEVLVVDDGSTDATAEVATALAARDARVRLLRSSAGNVGGTRNVGAAEARGEWLAFLDADDRLPPHSVRDRAGLLDGGDWRTAAAGGVRAFGARRSFVVPARPMSEVDRARAAAALVLPFHVGAILLHREAFDRVGGFSTAIARIVRSGVEDLLFVSDLVRAGVVFRSVRRPVLEYRLHRSSSSGSERAEHALAAAFARTVAAARMAGGAEPDPETFVARHGPEIVQRRATSAEVGLREAMIEFGSRSALRALTVAFAAAVRHPAYVAWRVRQSGFAVHDGRWGDP